MPGRLTEEPGRVAVEPGLVGVEPGRVTVVLVLPGRVVVTFPGLLLLDEEPGRTFDWPGRVTALADELPGRV